MNDLTVGLLFKANAAQAIAALKQTAGEVRALGAAAKTVSGPLRITAADIDRAFGIDRPPSRTQAEFDEMGRSLDALRARFNPVFGVLSRYRATLTEIRDAHARGAISTREMTAAISRERQAALASIAALKGRGQAVTQAARGLGRETGLAAGQVANLGAQFNDIGVMMMAGQSPLQLAMQQGTQITQVIGPMGAAGAVKALGAAFMSLLNPVSLVTIGVIAGGAALVQWLTSAGDEATSLEDEMTALAASVKEYGREVKAATAPVDDLIAKFGAQASAAREASRAIVDADRSNRLKGLGATTSKVAASFDGLGTAIAHLDAIREQAAAAGDTTLEMRAALKKLNDEFGLTESQARDVMAALNDLSAASGPDAVAAALARLRETLLGIAGDDEKLKQRFADIVIEISKGQLSALELSRLIGAAAGNGVRLGDAIAGISFAGAIAGADTLLGRLGAAARKARDIVGAVGEAQTRSLSENERLKLQEIEIKNRRNGASETDIARLLASERERYRLKDRGIPSAIVDRLVSDAGYRGAMLARRDATLRALRNPPAPPPAAGGAGKTGDGFDAIAARADAALARLGLAVAAVNEKVRAGLLGVAGGQKAIRQATSGAANTIAGLIPKLERAAETAGPGAAAKIRQLRQALKGLAGDLNDTAANMSRTFSDSFSRSFAAFVSGTKTAASAFRDFSRTVINEIARIISRRFTGRFVTPLIDSLLSVLPFAHGGVVGGAAPLSTLSAQSGTVGDRPIAFPMPGGNIGIAREAGREAILPVRAGPGGEGVLATGPGGRTGVLPLRRTPGGDLGVSLPDIVQSPTFFARGGVIGRIAAPAHASLAPAAGGSGREIVPVTVSVINNAPGVEARQQERRDGNGGHVIEVLIERIEAGIAANARRGVGPMADLLSTRYGLGGAVR